MAKLILLAFFPCCFSSVSAQSNYIVYKKNSKPIASFWKGSFITFQLKNNEWIKGIITGIESDSFSLKKQYIRYNMMGNDTFHISGFQYAFSDLYAMPKPGVQIDYLNGSWKINGEGGHVHWYWVKSGWIFRIMPAGYVALDLANGLIKNNFSFSARKFGIATIVFLAGVILHKAYQLTHRLGKKYHLEIIHIPPPGKSLMTEGAP